MAKQNQSGPQVADPRPESCMVVPVPLSLELELARQNQELAEFRIDHEVRLGRAWEIDRPVSK